MPRLKQPSVARQSLKLPVSGSVPARYASRLSPKDTQLQKSYLDASRILYDKGVYLPRPKLKSFKNRRSKWVIAFEKRYPGVSLDNQSAVQAATGLPRGAIRAILSKGRGAYYSSGSRPNQSAESWALARLASVVMGGPARKVDYHIISSFGQQKRFPLAS